MTVGSPFKIILLFSIPLVLSATLQQLYNLADNFIAGHFIANLDSFNAVGIVYPITVVFLDIAVGFGVGCGVVAAKFFGAKDMKNLKKTATVGLISTIVLGLVVTAVGLAVIYPLLNWDDWHRRKRGLLQRSLILHAHLHRRGPFLIPI